MINAGELKHRITIYAPGETTRDSKGEPTTAYDEVATVWAKVVTLSTREINLSRSVGGMDSHRVTIRQRSDVTRKCIITHDGRTYSVSGEPRDVDGQDHFLEFTVTAKS